MQYDTEVYRPPTAAAEASIPEDSRLAAAFRVIHWIVLGTVLAIWGVVGFIFWLPLMIKEVARFSVALIQSTMTGSPVHRLLIPGSRILSHSARFPVCCPIFFTFPP